MKKVTIKTPWGILSSLVFISIIFLINSPNNIDLLENNYTLIIIISLTLIAVFFICLLLLIIWQIKSRIKKVYGSILTTNLMIIFGLIGLIPGIIIYSVSLQYVSKSIEAWFELPLEGALKIGLKMSQNLINQQASSLLQEAKLIAETDTNKLFDTQYLKSVITNKNLLTISIFDRTAKIISSNSEPYSIPGDFELKQSHRGFSGVVAQKTNDQKFYLIKTIIALPKQDNYILQIERNLPYDLGESTQLLERTYSSYLTRNLARDNLINLYALNLTIVMLLSLLAAMLGAVYFSRKISKPLLHLAEGVKLIATGELKARPIVSNRDELGSLTTSFEIMTNKLIGAQNEIQNKQELLTASKSHLEMILTNMSAGVLVFDANFKIMESNPSASHILDIEIKDFIGKEISDIPYLEPLDECIRNGFLEIANAFTASGNQEWQKQMQIQGNQKDIFLWIRGNSISYLNSSRYIVVFDDITKTISTQRMSAWGEVAKRLAHEIRNPLTPIQLSAERLVLKVAPKIGENESKILIKSATTITQQVDALKKLVDDFRNFAEVQDTEKNSVNLNSIIDSVLDLYQLENINITSYLADNLPFIIANDVQVRQVLHNLLKNSIEAYSQKNSSHQDSVKESSLKITVHTKLVERQDNKLRNLKAVELTIEDNGGGISENILPRIFDPYVTSKVRGTGLGMSVVKKILDDHYAKIEITNTANEDNQIIGAKIRINFYRCQF